MATESKHSIAGERQDDVNREPPASHDWYQRRLYLIRER